MAEPAVIVEKDGHVLVVTLNRPEKRNAVNCEVMCRLYDAWVRARPRRRPARRDPDRQGRHLLRRHGPVGDRRSSGSGKPENEWMERVHEGQPDHLRRLAQDLPARPSP